METSKTVPLGDIEENDYNPRRGLGDIESLAESIREDGLIQALTVRPDGDSYEVISGSRRLAAIRQIHDDDYPVEVVVRDVDDETARRMALKENIEREDLTTMEEAWAFAREIEVDIDGRRLNLAEASRKEGGQVSLDSIPSVGAKNPDVQKVADAIGKSGDYVSQRLSFLTLPEDVQELVDTSDLTKRAARILARIDIDEPEARVVHIGRIVDSLPESMSDDDYQDLKDVIKSAEQAYEQRKNIAEDAVEDYAMLVDERKGELAEAIEAAAEEFDAEVTLSGQIDELAAEAEGAVERLGEARENAVSQRSAVTSRRDERQRAAARVEQAIAAHAGGGDCPYCGSAITLDDLGERKERLEVEVESAKEAIADIDDREGRLRKLRTRVQTSLNALDDTRDEYAKAKREAEQYAEVAADGD